MSYLFSCLFVIILRGSSLEVSCFHLHLHLDLDLDLRFSSCLFLFGWWMCFDYLLNCYYSSFDEMCHDGIVLLSCLLMLVSVILLGNHDVSLVCFRLSWDLVLNFLALELYLLLILDLLQYHSFNFYLSHHEHSSTKILADLQ